MDETEALKITLTDYKPGTIVRVDTETDSVVIVGFNAFLDELRNLYVEEAKKYAKSRFKEGLKELL